MSLYRRFVIEGNTAGPRLLIMAGIHGDEYEPMVAVDRLRTEIKPGTFAGRVTLIPLANESAYRAASRVGEDGLDLARTFPGKPEGSITQRMAAALNSEIHDSDFLIDLHTGGRSLEILPMTGFMLHSDERILEQQRKMAAAFGLPIVWGTSAELEGRSLSAARDANIPAIYAEQGGGSGFRADTVEAYVRGCRNVMRALHMLDSGEVSTGAPHFIDDRSHHSGHMQVCHPAGDDGVFFSTVSLGDVVKKGSELGRIINLQTSVQTLVLADKDGTVLTLYVGGYARRGTGLCVLIDLSSAREHQP